MTVQENASKPYCSPSDVATYFEKIDSFDANSSPRKQQVESIILQWSNYVDRYTGHAWREREVKGEYHDVDGPYYYWAGKPVKLLHREIRTPLDASKGDKIEIYNGDGYYNLVDDNQFNEGRNGDFWIDEANGLLYIYRRMIWPRRKGLRMDYRYGHPHVPEDIKQVCAKLTAADLMQSDQYKTTIPGASEAPDSGKVAEQWKEEAKDMLETRKEVKQIGGL